MEADKSIEIDEEKQYGLYKIERQNEQIKKTYSDHNAILKFRLYQSWRMIKEKESNYKKRI